MRVTEQCFSLILLKWLKFGKYFDLTSFIVLYCEKKTKTKTKTVHADYRRHHTRTHSTKSAKTTRRYLSFSSLGWFLLIPFFLHCFKHN